MIVSDYTKGLYHDKWIGGVLHYTGMGKNGDQNIHWAQNGTLANCMRNDVDVHIFEVMDDRRYTYCGRIEMVGKPYAKTQQGEGGKDRLVWMFPIRPVPENDVKKPVIFVFKDMDDYRARGNNTDTEYNKTRMKKSKRSASKVGAERVRHKAFDESTVIDIIGSMYKVQRGL